MDNDKNIQQDRLRGLMHSLPDETFPGGLNARIMERVLQEKSHLEKRAERRTLTWTIALAAVILGLGVYTLYTYIDWSFLSLRAAAPELAPPSIKMPSVASTASGEYLGQFKVLLPFAGIVLLLLIGDSLFRRRFFLKHHKE